MNPNEPASSAWLLRTGGCVTAIVVFLYFVGLWVGRALEPLKAVGKSVACQSNLRLLVRAERMYADDYEDRLPPASNWVDRIEFFLDPKESVHCPEAGKPPAKSYGYAMNGELGGKVQAKVFDLELCPLIFDSPDLTKSAVSKGLVLPAPGRHIGHEKKGQPVARGSYVGMADGRVKFVPDKK
jgi:hypothetical protein